MSAGKSSAVAAVAAETGVLDGTHADPAEDLRQADLLREELDLFADDLVVPATVRRPGRPRGSPNRSTLQLRKLLLQNGYRDPAEFLAALVSMGTSELAGKLDCDRIEALKVQRQAATDLMPYFHQRLPQEADQKPAEARPLVMIVEGARRVEAVTASGETMSVYDVEQDQRVSASDRAKSHDGGSHDEG